MHGTKRSFEAKTRFFFKRLIAFIILMKMKYVETINSCRLKLVRSLLNKRILGSSIASVLSALQPKAQVHYCCQRVVRRPSVRPSVCLSVRR